MNETSSQNLTLKLRLTLLYEPTAGSSLILLKENGDLPWYSLELWCERIGWPNQGLRGYAYEKST